MSKVLRYFLSSSLILSIFFLASCGEDTETPGGPLSVSTNPSDDQIVSPGEVVDIVVTLANASETAEVTALSDAGGDFVNQDNKAMSGETISFIVPADAEEGDEITLTFTVTDDGMQANSQLTLTVETTVVDIALQNEGFETLVAALIKADLVDALEGTGPFTVFAPTDAAFEALFTKLGIDDLDDLTAEQLTPILLYHVIEGSTVLAADLTEGTVATMEGSNIFVSLAGGAQINTATVDPADLTAGNGVVHVIDEVLLPSYSLINSEAVLLGSQGNSTEGSFYNALENQVLKFAAARDNSGTVDFLYYWGNTNNHSIAALDDSGAQSVFSASNIDFSGFTPKPQTRFMSTEITAAEFDALMSQADVEEAFLTDQTIDASSVTGLAVGDVFAVALDETRGGNVGLVKVLEVVGQGNTTGYIRLDVKIVR